MLTCLMFRLAVAVVSLNIPDRGLLDGSIGASKLCELPKLVNELMALQRRWPSS
jgi:hypothetical protein